MNDCILTRKMFRAYNIFCEVRAESLAAAVDYNIAVVYNVAINYGKIIVRTLRKFDFSPASQPVQFARVKLHFLSSLLRNYPSIRCDLTLLT